MAGPIRTHILTSWALPGFRSSHHFAPLRKECMMPRANREMWIRAFRRIVGDAPLLMGAPGSLK